MAGFIVGFICACVFVLSFRYFAGFLSLYGPMAVLGMGVALTMPIPDSALSKLLGWAVPITIVILWAVINDLNFKRP